MFCQKSMVICNVTQINTVIYTTIISLYSLNETLNLDTDHVTCQRPSWQRISALTHNWQAMAQGPSRCGHLAALALSDRNVCIKSFVKCSRLVCLDVSPPEEYFRYLASYRTGTTHTSTASRKGSSSSEKILLAFAPTAKNTSALTKHQPSQSVNMTIFFVVRGLEVLSAQKTICYFS
jgi:hypothetical protein